MTSLFAIESIGIKNDTINNELTIAANDKDKRISALAIKILRRMKLDTDENN